MYSVPDADMVTPDGQNRRPSLSDNLGIVLAVVQTRPEICLGEWILQYDRLYAEVGVTRSFTLLSGGFFFHSALSRLRHRVGEWFDFSLSNSCRFLH